jgi:hypothetical protein
MSKEDKIWIEERKMRPGMLLKQELAETARARTSSISQNNRMPLQTKPKKIKPIQNHKRG